jgi:hypothetical protein
MGLGLRYRGKVGTALLGQIRSRLSCLPSTPGGCLGTIAQGRVRGRRDIIYSSYSPSSLQTTVKVGICWLLSILQAYLILAHLFHPPLAITESKHLLPSQNAPLFIPPDSKSQCRSPRRSSKRPGLRLGWRRGRASRWIQWTILSGVSQRRPTVHMPSFRRSSRLATPSITPRLPRL